MPLLVTCASVPGAPGDGSADGDGIRTDGCAGAAGHTAAGIAAVLAGIAAILTGVTAAVGAEPG